MKNILTKDYFWGDLELPLREQGGSLTETLIVNSADMRFSEALQVYEFEGIKYLYGDVFYHKFIDKFGGNEELFGKVKSALYNEELKASPIANYVWLMIENKAQTKRMEKMVAVPNVANMKMAYNAIEIERVKNRMRTRYCDTLNRLIAQNGLKYSSNFSIITENGEIVLDNFEETVIFDLRNKKFLIKTKFNPYFL